MDRKRRGDGRAQAVTMAEARCWSPGRRGWELDGTVASTTGSKGRPFNKPFEIVADSIVPTACLRPRLWIVRCWPMIAPDCTTPVIAYHTGG